jgi:hypothetical protein
MGKKKVTLLKVTVPTFFEARVKKPEPTIFHHYLTIFAEKHIITT